MDDGGEVVVGQDHISGALGHIGAGDAHGAADVGHLQGGGVVDAVTGHGHYPSLGLPCLDNTHLVLGGHTGIHRISLHVLLQSRLVHGVQILSGDGHIAVPEDVQFLGDGHSGELVVAGDHDRTDAGGVALGHGLLDLHAGRVDHAHQAHEGQAGLQALGGELGGDGLHVFIGHAQHAQGPGSHLLVLLHGRVGSGLVDIAAAQQHIGRALDHDAVLALEGVDGGHELPVGVEGQLRHTGHGLLDLVLVQALLHGDIHEGGLGGVAGGLGPAVLVVGQDGVVTQGADGEGEGPPILRGGPHVHHGHLVHGQGARLIRTDDGGAAQGLHGGQLLDDGVALDHALHAQGQHDGDHGGQSLGDSGHGQGHGGHEDLQQLHAVEQSHAEHDHAHGQADDGQGLGDLGHLLLEGGLVVVLGGQHLGDAAHLGLHAGGGDHTGGAAVGDDGGGDDHVLPVAQSGLLGKRVNHFLAYRYGLAGHGGFVRLQVGALQDTGVGGDQIARLQHDDIAGHQLAGLHADDLAVPDDFRQRRGHLLQGLQGLVGVVLLGDGDHRVDHHDQEDDRRIHPVGEAAGHIGEHGGRQQHDDHGIPELVQDTLEHAVLLVALQLVGAVLLQTGLPLLGGETGLGISA